MPIVIREGRPEDAQECGQICFDSFYGIAAEHNFQPDFPTVDSAVLVVSFMLSHPGFYCAIAERDGKVIGSNFLDERAEIVGLGPITVLKQAQNAGVGRLLLGDALERSDQRGVVGVRLVQAAYHGRSMSLYVKHGFVIREPLAVIKGTCPTSEMAEHHVRSVEVSDLEACEKLCMSVHGYDRSWELRDAISANNALLVEVHGQVVAYTTSVGFAGYTVGQTSNGVKALIKGTDRIHGPGFLLPLRWDELLSWCLQQGLRIEQPLSLMSRGDYREPEGAFLPSIAY